MKDTVGVIFSLLAGAAVAAAFYEYWIAAWIGLALFALGAITPTHTLLALAGAYLGGVLFHLLALGWMRSALSNAEALALAHYFALGWVITAIILRLLPGYSKRVALPIAWTIGTAAPVLVLVACFGRIGHFYMNRIAQTQLGLPVAQLADLGGMPAVEFALAAMVGSLVDRRLRGLVACSILLLGVCAYAHIRTTYANCTGTIRAALFQKYEPQANGAIADLFVWPEGNRWRVWSEEEWKRFAHGLGGIAVVGASRAEGAKDFNSVLIATNDSVRYVDKRFLVAGGETSSPIDWMFGSNGDNDLFEAGQGPVCHECNGVSLSVCICYEMTIPRLATADTQVIVNSGCEQSIASDNGPSTMLNHARLRAIEARRPVVRAVLAGYTAIIDGSGRVIEAAIDKPLVGEVPLDSRFSLYSAIGDWITPLCAIVGLLLIWRGKKQS